MEKMPGNTPREPGPVSSVVQRSFVGHLRIKSPIYNKLIYSKYSKEEMYRENWIWNIVSQSGLLSGLLSLSLSLSLSPQAVFGIYIANIYVHVHLYSHSPTVRGSVHMICPAVLQWIMYRDPAPVLLFLVGDLSPTGPGAAGTWSERQLKKTAAFHRWLVPGVTV